MARLASDAIMGYYPTGVSTIKKVIDMSLEIQPGTKVIDPCCGEGEALASFRNYDCDLYGVELDIIRSQKATTQIDCLLNADAIYGVRRSLGWAGLVFLNPPYGVNFEGERLELQFIRNWGGVVRPKGGALMLVINPSSADETMAKSLRGLGLVPIASVYDPDSEDYQKFGQFFIVFRREILGHRHPLESMMDALTNPVELGTIEYQKYTPLLGENPNVFKECEFPRWKLDALYAKSNLSNKLMVMMKTTHIGCGSIETPNEGQSALLIASGVLDKEIDGLVLKGTVEKFQVAASVNGDDGELSKVKMIDCYRTVVIGLDTKTFEFVKYE